MLSFLIDRIDSAKLWSIARGAIIAGLGATAAYLASQGPIAGAIAAIIVNVIYQMQKPPTPLPEDYVEGR